MLGKVPGVQYEGSWTSAGCASRTFARNITLWSDGEYAGIDLISPCPAGTTCAWSGLVTYAGIWKQEGDTLQLREIGAPFKPGAPHPTEFRATTDGKLVENDCFYEKGLTTPAGYTPDQVLPRLPGQRDPPEKTE
jgi:hypothetical protein